MKMDNKDKLILPHEKQKLQKRIEKFKLIISILLTNIFVFFVASDFSEPTKNCQRAALQTPTPHKTKVKKELHYEIIF
ncbi:MAG: hypothetical protein ISR65_08025 [Bacteriovoracaceae bacterium]|nr:hypothetical protein [Bacteriovoracaceae bacterium]